MCKKPTYSAAKCELWRHRRFFGLSTLLRVNSRLMCVSVYVVGLRKEKEPGSSKKRLNNAGERTIGELLKIIAECTSFREALVNATGWRRIGISDSRGKTESIRDIVFNCFRRRRVDVKCLG